MFDILFFLSMSPPDDITQYVSAVGIFVVTIYNFFKLMKTNCDHTNTAHDWCKTTTVG